MWSWSRFLKQTNCTLTLRNINQKSETLTGWFTEKAASTTAHNAMWSWSRFLKQINCKWTLTNINQKLETLTLWFTEKAASTTAHDAISGWLSVACLQQHNSYFFEKEHLHINDKRHWTDKSGKNHHHHWWVSNGAHVMPNTSYKRVRKACLEGWKQQCTNWVEKDSNFDSLDQYYSVCCQFSQDVSFKTLHFCQAQKAIFMQHLALQKTCVLFSFLFSFSISWSSVQFFPRKKPINLSDFCPVHICVCTGHSHIWSRKVLFCKVQHTPLWYVIKYMYI